MMDNTTPSNYEQAVAWLQDANRSGDDRFQSADAAKQTAWTAAAQVFALLAVADAINELRADVTAGLSLVQRQLESMTFTSEGPSGS
jgi:hypothetical protein